MKMGYVNPVCDLDALAQMDAQLIRYTGCQVTNDGAITPTNEVTTSLTSEPGSTILPGDQMPISTTPTPENGEDGSLQTWFEKNKYLVIGGGLLLFFLLSKKRR